MYRKTTVNCNKSGFRQIIGCETLSTPQERKNISLNFHFFVGKSLWRLEAKSLLLNM